MPKGAVDVPISVRWHCICGASWSARLVRTPKNPDLGPVVGSLRAQWERAHMGPGHGWTGSGRAAAWARRKAEQETG